MRTAKTALAVFFITLMYDFLPARSPQIASLSAVFALRKDMGETFNFGRIRAFANVVGGLVSAGIVFSLRVLPEWRLIYYVSAPIGLALTIMLCISLNIPQGVVGASATYLIIFFNIPEEAQYAYIFNRILDTFIGAFVALAIEWLLPRERTDRIVTWWKSKISKAN
ncbi:FUSC family protein [Hutsoniella sourekii]